MIFFNQGMLLLGSNHFLTNIIIIIYMDLIGIRKLGTNQVIVAYDEDSSKRNKLVVVEPCPVVFLRLFRLVLISFKERTPAKIGLFHFLSSLYATVTRYFPKSFISNVPVNSINNNLLLSFDIVSLGRLWQNLDGVGIYRDPAEYAILLAPADYS